VARCTIERLMGRLGLQGVIRGYLASINLNGRDVSDIRSEVVKRLHSQLRRTQDGRNVGKRTKAEAGDRLN